MGLQAKLGPDSLHPAERDAGRHGHRPAGPVDRLTGGSAQVMATIRLTVAADRGDVPGGRVLSRTSPAGPSSAKRRRQHHMTGRLTPARRATSATASRAADSSTISARWICFFAKPFPHVNHLSRSMH